MLVISGIDGIGRKAYVRGMLKDVGIMEKHYFPLILALDGQENIDDLIIKISDLDSVDNKNMIE